jgi:hypothetical protein
MKGEKEKCEEETMMIKLRKTEKRIIPRKEMRRRN